MPSRSQFEKGIADAESGSQSNEYVTAKGATLLRPAAPESKYMNALKGDKL
jgi:hypothetical protein